MRVSTDIILFRLVAAYKKSKPTCSCSHTERSVDGHEVPHDHESSNDHRSSDADGILHGEEDPDGHTTSDGDGDGITHVYESQEGDKSKSST